MGLFRFEGDVRDGFYVSGMMKKAWAVHIENYEKLSEICKANSISAPTLMWGSLIGAIRHGGFIPWDDDIDTQMKHEDYEVLKGVVSKGDFPENYELRDFLTKMEENWVRSFWDSDRPVVHPDRWDERHGFPYAAAIDIFLMDRIPQDENKREDYDKIIEKYVLMKSVAKSLYVENTETVDIKEEDFLARLSEFEKEVGQSYDKDGDIPLWAQILVGQDEYSLRCNEHYTGLYAMIPYYRNDHSKVIDERLYAGSIEVPYEDGKVSVPIGYDGIMRQFFGNYMTPILEGSVHEYPFYKRLEKQVKEEFGIEFSKYHIDVEEIKKIRSDSLYISLSEAVGSLKEAHAYIRDTLRSGQVSEDVFGVLSACQDMAVSIGERIEAKARNPERIVKSLEEYCEFLYKLSQDLSLESELDGWDDKLESMVNCSLNEKKEVVFLVCHGKWWDQGYRSLYEEMISKEDVNVTVIVVPVYERDASGEIVRDSIKEDSEGIPDDVVLTPYDEYSFPERMPDEVYIQTPMDEYEIGMSVHPFFYSSSIRKYVKKLIFVTPFFFREAESVDNRIGYALSQYMCKPGLVYADEVIVQSEIMAGMWCDIWDGFLENEGVDDEIKDKSFLGLTGKITWKGSPVTEYRKRIKSEREKAKGEKKILAYYVSGSVLYEHGDKMLKKVEDALAYLDEHKAVVDTVWCQDPYLDEILGKYAPDVYEGYQKLLSTKEDYGASIRVLNEYDMGQLAESCDMIYGDGGVLMNAFREAEKLMLFEDPNEAASKELDKLEI